MRYWWVNQTRTHEQDIPGGFLWSPQTQSDGRSNRFYDNMREVQPGDVVFSFYDKSIKAVGIVTGIAKTAPKPDFGTTKEQWEKEWLKEGWLVPVEFKELDMAFNPKDLIEQLRPLFQEKRSHAQSFGTGYEHFYLADLPEKFGVELISLLGKSYDIARHELLGRIAKNSAEDTFEESIKGGTDIEDTV